MICTLLVVLPAPDHFPGRNTAPVLGRPLVSYPIMAALSSPSVDRLYVATDADDICQLAESLGARTIPLPPDDLSPRAMVIKGARALEQQLKAEGASLELLAVMFAHGATITSHTIEEGIAVLRKDPEIDAAVTVSRSWHSRSETNCRISKRGLIESAHGAGTWTPFYDEASDSEEQALWFSDGGATVVRPPLLEIANWTGRSLHPLRQVGGMAVNESWQIPVVEGWLQAQRADSLFTAKRTQWSQYYDSERAVLSSLQLISRSSVLDIGGDPGGLGVALQERFGITAYSAVVPEGGAGELQAINPDAKSIVGRIETLPLLDPDGFDLVSALGVADTTDFLPRVLPAAFRQVIENGAVVFSLRLTNGPTIADAKISYQDVIVAKGERIRRSYIIRNTAEVMNALRSLNPARIMAYGYLGRPPSTAHTPADSICYAVFALFRRIADGPAEAETQLDLHLPPEFVRT